MKRRLVLLCIIFIFSNPGISNAELFSVVYDSMNDTYWMQERTMDIDNLMTLMEANTYADNLVYANWDDWRLPDYNEVRHIQEDFDISAIVNPEPFSSNLYQGFWMSTPYPGVPSYYYIYAQADSYDEIGMAEDIDDEGDIGIGGVPMGAWVVRDASVKPIPEPATILMLGSGLLGAAALRRKKKKT